MAILNNENNQIISQSSSIYFKGLTLPLNLQKLVENKIHLVTIDAGFGSTKVFSANGKHIYPSYVSQLENDKENAYLTNNHDILIKHDNHIYRVGEVIRSQVTNNVTNNNVNVYLDTKSLIESKEYLITHMAALAMSLVDDPNEFLNSNPLTVDGDLQLVLGVPIKELTEQVKEKITDRITSISKFYIRTNKSNVWKEVKVNIKKSNVEVTGQPLGTLQSLVKNIDGTTTDISDELYSSEEGQVLILDGGYGTFDTVIINSGMIESIDTWTDCAMSSILEETNELIYKDLMLKNDKVSKLTILGVEKVLVDWLRKGNSNYVHKEIKKGILDLVVEDIPAKLESAIKSKAVIVTNHMKNKFGDYSSLRVILTGGTTKLMKSYIENYCNKVGYQVFWSEQKEYDGDFEIFNFDSVFANVYGYFAYKIADIFSENNWDLYAGYEDELEEDEYEEITDEYEEIETDEYEEVVETIETESVKEVAVTEEKKKTKTSPRVKR